MGARKLVTGVVSVAAVGLVGMSIFRALSAGPADVPRKTELDNAKREAKVEAAPATDFRQPLDSSAAISGHGIVEPADREVKVGSRVPGLVQRIRVQEGNRVAAGALLVELASDAERAAVSAAKADLDAATARLAISSLTARRAEQLERDGAISRDERDRSVSQANIDRAGVDQARSRLTEAGARLSQLNIKAPSAGTILKLSVREGEFYSPDGEASLVTLGDMTRVRVRLDIDERFIGRVFVGQPGYAVVQAYNNRKFAGKVVDIAPRMGRKNQRTDDPTERIDTKIREVMLQLDNGSDLVPGLAATGYLSGTKIESGGAQVASDSKGSSVTASAGTQAPAKGGLVASASVTTGTAPATAEEWDRRGTDLLTAGKDREAVAAYREAVLAHPGLQARVKELAVQHRGGNLELAYCLDPSDKTLAAAWSKAEATRRSLCAESN